MDAQVKDLSRRTMLLGLLAAAAGVACDGSNSPTAPSPTATRVADSAPFSITDIEIGSGDEVGPGQRVSVYYTGYFYSATATNREGAQFATTCPRHCTEFIFTLGAGEAIRGLEQGVLGMRVGGTRRVVVPPWLGYGATGLDTRVPPNATLVYRVVLKRIVPS